MELVGTHQIFCLLLDHTILIGRNELRRNRCVNDIQQRLGSHLASHIAHQIADKGLGDARIHAVHRHVVAIIRGQLRQVTGTHHDTVYLIGHIHQDLRTLASLTVLIGDIMHFSIMTDILEMLCDSLGNTDLTDGDVQGLHQCHRIVIGAVGRAEAWHRDANDALATDAELIKRLHRDKQRQRRVETATDANDGFLSIDMIQTFGQTCHLNIQNLLTGGLHIGLLRNEGMGIDIADEFEVARGY